MQGFLVCMYVCKVCKSDGAFRISVALYLAIWLENKYYDIYRFYRVALSRRIVM